MVTKIYTVYDSKAEVYGPCMFQRTKVDALRAWQNACNDTETPMYKYPADFTMFEIGEFNDETGSISMHPAKQSMGTAFEYKKTRDISPLTAVKEQ